jgi:hypothetical protein
MRMGISLYEQDRFHPASRHFLVAWTMNPADTLAQEYAYFSLLQSWQSGLADQVASASASSGWARRKGVSVPLKTPRLSALQGGATVLHSGLSDALDLGSQPDSVSYAEQTRLARAEFAHAFADIRLGLRSSGQVGYSFAQVHSEGQVLWADSVEIREHSSPNHQLNLAFAARAGHSVQVGATAGWLREEAYRLSAEWDSVALRLVYRDLFYQHDAWTALIWARKTIPGGSVALEIGGGSARSQEHYQVGLDWVYYPLGNTRWYWVTRVALLNVDQNWQGVLEQRSGWTINKRFGLEAEWGIGNFTNYQSQAGFVVYNTAEAILWRGQLGPRLQFGHFGAQASYTLQQRESELFVLSENGAATSNPDNFLLHAATLSCTWTF